MPMYGTCSECGRTVWLTQNGACPQGHGPECISGIAESAAAPAPTAAPVVAAAPGVPANGGKKSKAPVIIAVVVVVLLLCCLAGGILSAIAIPTFSTASDSARERACFSQQRVLEGAVIQWCAEQEQRTTGDIPDYETLLEWVAPVYAPATYTCPSDGTYTYDPATGQVTCSTHGHFE